MVKTMENFNARENHGTKMEESGSYSVESMWIWQNVEHKASFDRSPTPYIPKAHSGKNQGWRSRAFIVLSLAPWILQQWQPWLVAHFTCGGTLHLWRHICLIGAIRTLFLNLKSGGYVCRLRVLCVSNLQFPGQWGRRKLQVGDAETELLVLWLELPIFGSDLITEFFRLQSGLQSLAL